MSPAHPFRPLLVEVMVGVGVIGAEVIGAGAMGVGEPETVVVGRGPLLGTNRWRAAMKPETVVRTCPQLLSLALLGRARLRRPRQVTSRAQRARPRGPAVVRLLTVWTVPLRALVSPWPRLARRKLLVLR